MLVGVSWRERAFDLLRKQVLRSIAIFNNTAEYRKLYSSENNMPSSDAVGPNSPKPVELRFAKLTENASTPTRGSKLAAGFDLHRLLDSFTPLSHYSGIYETRLNSSVLLVHVFC